MGYQKIQNLYQNVDVLLFRECYAMEKIHGSSAHVAYNSHPDLSCNLTFFPGGESHVRFTSIFDQPDLHLKFAKLGVFTIIVHGEVYGGKCQKQSHRYGKDLKFVAFDVLIDDHWLSVPNAHDVCKKLGIEFVHYVKGPATLEFVDEQRDLPSVQAVRNGITEPKTREGIVIRPLIELTKNNGSRVISKHKGDEFKETKTPREVDPVALKVLSDAAEVAEEWVVPMRLEHVIDKLSVDGKELTIKDTKSVIVAMIEDVKAESVGEVVWSKPVSSSIGRRAAQMFKKRISKIPL